MAFFRHFCGRLSAGYWESRHREAPSAVAIQGRCTDARAAALDCRATCGGSQ